MAATVRLAGIRANVYIDGFNLYYGSIKGNGPGYKWLDLDVLCSKYLIPANPINRIRYFTARISARPGDPGAPVRQETYLRAIATLPSVSVHLGHFQQTKVRMPLVNPAPTGEKTAKVYKTEEKGSDVNLATYLLLDAFRHDCDLAVVISNDSDLEAPIGAVMKELGIPVGLLNPHPAWCRSRDLLNLKPAFFKQIRTNAIKSSQFPERLSDERGTFRRPPGW
ncbi:MAG TPA: NYN domain-containing protein [Streptosporangiaceae bacterium]|nr:NYN domain-containing protein [Streptosporangiaceae bacterium]